MGNLVSIPIENGSKYWIDVTDPSPELLNELALKHGLHPAFVKDCLDPSHLPKYEQSGETTFSITRAFDDQAEDRAETVQQLTRKVAIFTSPKIVLTIHRVDQPFIQKLRQQWKESGEKRTQTHLINSLLAKIISSYNSLIDRSSARIDALEEEVFRGTKDRELLEKAYALKRVTSVSERLIRMTEEIIPSSEGHDREAAFVRELQDQIRRVLFSFDDSELRIDHMLQLHLAIESQKTNEVMRVLTLFSVFFLPLTFIAGIYGMNFAHMPELAWRLGYPFSLGLMILISIIIAFWFRKKGWLGR